MITNNSLFNVKSVAKAPAMLGIKITKGQTVNSKKFLVKKCEHKKGILSANNTVSRKNIMCKHNLVATEINVRLTKGEI